MLTIPFKSPSRLLIPFFLQLLYLVHLQEIVKIPIGVVHRFSYYFIYLLSIFLFCLSDILLSCFIFPAKKAIPTAPEEKTNSKADQRNSTVKIKIINIAITKTASFVPKFKYPKFIKLSTFFKLLKAHN
ncbi:hypothetical protein HMPREF9520_02977 [Enterococcus faecalis TX1467]|nr:hypothetical protein HMPREF9520_02977 [Enterococcus faecalis TX1467]